MGLIPGSYVFCFNNTGTLGYEADATSFRDLRAFGLGTGFGWGTAVAQWLRCCATNRKVAGSIPDGVIGIFH